MHYGEWKIKGKLFNVFRKGTKLGSERVREGRKKNTKGRKVEQI